MTLGTKQCEYCGIDIVLTIQRDIIRKRFCSHKCRQLWRYSQGEWTMDKMHQRCNTPEANAKKSHKGENHPLYKPDRSQIKSPRPRYENDQWRKAIFERDNYTCQLCGLRGGPLHADHIKPYAAYPELRWELSNGRTLCVPCHKKTPTYGRKL